MEIDFRIEKEEWKGAKKKEGQKGGKENNESWAKHRPWGFVVEYE